jgi:hypothetical protein
MIRASVVAVLFALAGGWVAYVHLWRYGGAHPIAYRLATLPNFEAPQPFYSVTIFGSQEHVLITAGPRSSTGYSIKIERALVERSRVSIVVREIDRPGRAAITYPYRLLVFPNTHKPVHVHWEGRS